MTSGKQEFLRHRKIAAADTPRVHYHADAAVVWCFDDRFSGLLAAFLEAKGIAHKDLICIAGGLKTLTSPAKESDRDFVLAQIQGSMALHDAKTVYLMAHSDCGKYGGIKAFDGDENKELEHIRAEAQKAEEYLKINLPFGVHVESVFADFDGIYQLA